MAKTKTKARTKARIKTTAAARLTRSEKLRRADIAHEAVELGAQPRAFAGQRLG
jgi:hypothetical protein